MGSRPTVRRSATTAVAAMLSFVLAAIAPRVAHADQQRDPELRAIVGAAIAEAECFTDSYDAEVWYKMMEPRLRRPVTDRAERILILKHVFCEATRPDVRRLPPGLVMAIIDVESRFNRWAVSSAGAVGLMQVMPFWPEELGMRRHQLTKVPENIKMGTAIFRYYLQRERGDVAKALARYNGSVGRTWYSNMVIGRWTRWNGADDLGIATATRRAPPRPPQPVSK